MLHEKIRHEALSLTGVERMGGSSEEYMASAPREPFNIEVKFEHRDDGGLRAYSDSLPGFVISHEDPERVIAEVPPVLEVILSAMMQAKVRVTPTVDLAELIGLEAPMLPAYMCDRVYMGEAIAVC